MAKHKKHQKNKVAKGERQALRGYQRSLERFGSDSLRRFRQLLPR